MGDLRGNTHVEEPRRKMPTSSGTAVLSAEYVCTHYAPLVETIVTRLHVPDGLRDDAMQEGFGGLLEALRRYDTSSPVHFSLFARPYVKGAILRRIYTRTQVTETSMEDPYLGDETAGGTFEVESTVVQAIQVEAWLATLPTGDAWVLRRLYWDDADTSQIAAELGVTRRRINQIHNKLLRQGADALGEVG
jgi:RNA polymerase sigma factor (sigma-70 family)